MRTVFIPPEVVKPLEKKAIADSLKNDTVKSRAQTGKQLTLQCGASGAGMLSMKRRTFRQLRSKAEAGLHHHVYVVLLNASAGKLRKVRAENPKRDPKKPCVYVGMTGLTPEERFANHRAGIKAAAVVKRHGIRLLPELYRHLNPMPFEAAVAMEMDLAEDLRRAGYTVAGGH